jgi:hypothetical protein
MNPHLRIPTSRIALLHKPVQPNTRLRATQHNRRRVCDRQQNIHTEKAFLERGIAAYVIA